MHLYEQIRDVNVAMRINHTLCCSVRVLVPNHISRSWCSVCAFFRFITFAWYTIFYTSLMLYSGIFDACTCNTEERSQGEGRNRSDQQKLFLISFPRSNVSLTSLEIFCCLYRISWLSRYSPVFSLFLSCPALLRYN